MLLNVYRLRIADNSVNQFKNADSKQIQIENFLMCYMGQSGYNQTAEAVKQNSQEYFWAIGTFGNCYANMSEAELKANCYALVFENYESGNIVEMYYITENGTIKYVKEY